MGGPKFVTPISRAEVRNAFHHVPPYLPPNILSPLPSAESGRRGGLSSSFGRVSARLSSPGRISRLPDLCQPKSSLAALGQAFLLLSRLAPVLLPPLEPLQAHQTRFPQPLCFSEPLCFSNGGSCRKFAVKSCPLGLWGDCFYSEENKKTLTL